MSKTPALPPGCHAVRVEWSGTLVDHDGQPRPAHVEGALSLLHRDADDDAPWTLAQRLDANEFRDLTHAAAWFAWMLAPAEVTDETNPLDPQGLTITPTDEEGWTLEEVQHHTSDANHVCTYGSTFWWA